MNFGLLSQNRYPKGLSRFVDAAVIIAAVVLVFVPSASSQQLPRPPAWSVQSTDPAHSSLTLKGTVILGIDTGMFWVVQFRIEGSGPNQLASFQPNMAVVLETSGPKLQAPAALGAKTGGKAQPQIAIGAKSPATSAVFTGIPTVDQTLVIQASGISSVEGVVISVSGPQSYVVGQPGGSPPPCCAVTIFNSETGIATAKVNASGQIFMFQAPLAPPHEGPPPQFPQYQQLNVGQPVWANLTTGQVSLNGTTVCCQITAEGISSSSPGGKPPAVGIKNPIATTPACCTIMALYSSQQGPPGGVGPGGQAGSVAAKVNSNAQEFVFVVNDAALFASLKVGQPVWANFTTEQVSLDGKTPCCTIMTEGTPSSAAGVKPTPVGKKPVTTTAACCEITALNQQAKTASAKVKSTGQAFQIGVSNPALFQSLRVGQAIWANFKTREISLNGAGPANGMQIIGSIVAGGPFIANIPGLPIAKKKPPYTAIPSPSSPPLTMHDHTLIMQTVFQNRMYLARKISRHNWQKATAEQNAIGAMLFLLESPSVPEATKERVRVYLATLRNTKLQPLSPTHIRFTSEASATLATAKDASSATQALTTLQRRYAKQPTYVGALTLAKDLIKDGASTIYSPTWLAQNSQGSTGGSGVSTRADVLDPNCGSDLSDGCMGGGGGSPYPGEGGCDPSTDPYGCEPPPPPPPPACPDPTNPLCGPDCATDPTNPDCNSCPDPTNPACNTGACPDGTNPPCGPPPPTCPDPNNPNCGSQGNCVVLVPCPPGGNSGPDPCNLILNPAQTGCPSPIPVPVQQADIKGCIYGSGGGAIPVYSNPHLWPAIGVACLAVGTAYSIVAGLGIK